MKIIFLNISRLNLTLMKKYFLLLFLFTSIFVSAQVEIKAKILNQESKVPVEFASVLILDVLEGTITDTTGFFSLKVDTISRHILVQSLGYESDTFLVKDILNQKLIYLKPTLYNLNDVVVYPQNAFEIVRKAVDKIPDNYDAPTIAQNVYYKQTIVANNQILSLQEANFDALLKFKNENANIATIKKARAYMNLDTLKSLGKLVEKQLEEFDSTNIRDNASQFFNMSYMLNDEIGEDNQSLFGQKGIKNYKYNYNGLVEKDGFYAYHITFDQLDEIKKSLFKGHFYIDTASFAFIEAQIYLSPKGIEYQKVIPKSATMLAKLFGYTIYFKGLNYNLHYQKVADKWVLDKAFSRLDAIVSKKNGPTFDGYLNMEFLVQDFFLKEGFYNKQSKYDILKSNIKDFKNPNFWENLGYKALTTEEKRLINSVK